jgi:cytochrome oxidase Cu insertion factor (SCO1/SenC/PrrC family)
MMKLSQYFWRRDKLKSADAARIEGTAMPLMFAAGLLIAATFALAAMAVTAPPYLPLHVQVGEKAPDFALPSANGDTVKLSQFAGHNVLLDFYEGYW